MVTPTTTTKFHDSIGVNTAAHFLDTPYKEWGTVLGILKDIGFKVIRDGGITSTDAGWNKAVETPILAAIYAGIKLLAGIGHTPKDDAMTAQSINLCATKYKGALVGLEGPNEIDWDHGQAGGVSPTWDADAKHWLQYVYPRVRGNGALNYVPVVGPTVVAASNITKLGDISPWIDRGNIHPYRGGTSPSNAALVEQYNLYKPMFGTKIRYASECGYHTAVNMPVGANQPPVNEYTQAVYTIRTYLEHFSGSVPVTTLFSLLDWRPNPGKDDAEAQFGIIRYGFSYKQAATALKAFIKTLGPDGPTSVKPVDISVVNPNVRRLILQRTDGTYLVILWRTVSIWDRDKRVQIKPDTLLTDVLVPGAKSVACSIPTGCADWMGMQLTNGKVVAGVAGDPLVLRVSY